MAEAGFVRAALLCAALLASAPPSQAGDDRALDGKAFDGEIRDERGAALSRDVITFRDGRFHSLTCESMGFGETAYWMRRGQGGDIDFMVEASHQEHGRLRIVGTVAGTLLKAQGEWVKERWYWTVRQRIRFEATEKR